MPFYEKGQVRIHYEEAGSGFPLLVIPGGGLNSTIEGLKTHPFNPLDEFKNDYRVIAADLRNANGGQSTGPLEIDRPWDAYTDDHLGLMDHLGIREFMVLGFCIGGPFIWNLLKRAGDRVVAGVLTQPSGFRPTMPDLFYQNNIKGWAPKLVRAPPRRHDGAGRRVPRKHVPQERRLRVHGVARFRAPVPHADPDPARRCRRRTPRRWRWRPPISRPTRRSACIRGRRTRSRSGSRCATSARSSKPTGRPPRGSLSPPPHSRRCIDKRRQRVALRGPPLKAVREHRRVQVGGMPSPRTTQPYRRDAGRGGGSARHPVGRDQAPRDPAWLCAAATALGAILRLDRPLPPPRSRL